jgi:peptidylprolyl isomerase
VKKTDQVTVQYQGVLWRTGKVFDQSWGTSPASFLPTQVVPGFGKALIGHKVGSQVVAIIPPSQGYGSAGQSSAGIKGTDTMVFVVDILASAPAAG